MVNIIPVSQTYLKRHMKSSNDNIVLLEKLQPKTTKSGKTRSQIGKSSKSKGKTGERFFADILSNVSGLSFLRVPNSGAFVGQSNRNKLQTLTRTQSIISLGDIICPEELKNYYIFECKNYGSNVDFHNMLLPSGSKNVLGWLNEMLYDVESAYMYLKSPKPVIGFLCLKLTRKGAWIIGNTGIINNYNIPFPVLYFTHNINEILANNGWNDIFFITDFSNLVKYNQEKLFEIGENNEPSRIPRNNIDSGIQSAV